MSGVTRSLPRRLAVAATILSLTGLAFVRAPSVSASSVSGPTVVGTINGGGTALMTSGPTAGGKSVSSFGIHATLFSDGSAQGHFDCVDQMGDTMPGNVFGDITSWTKDANTGLISLYSTDGSLVGTHGGTPVHHRTGHPIVTIQKFGGAGVGHWTLTPGKLTNPPVCIELLISGQIVGRGLLFN
jgi:hypothetical protein